MIFENKKIKISKNKNAGFTLFVAVIVTGILTIIAMGIAALSTREISLANTNRESGKAIFAANAGIECAMYWDSRFDVSWFDPSNPPGSSITCGGVTMSNGQALPASSSTVTQIGGSSKSVFGFSFNTGSNPINACVIVIVNKDGVNTKINSYGYNTCDTNDSRRVERGVEVRY